MSSKATIVTDKLGYATILIYRQSHDIKTKLFELQLYLSLQNIFLYLSTKDY